MDSLRKHLDNTWSTQKKSSSALADVQRSCEKIKRNRVLSSQRAERKVLAPHLLSEDSVGFSWQSGNTNELWRDTEHLPLVNEVRKEIEREKQAPRTPVINVGLMDLVLEGEERPSINGGKGEERDLNTQAQHLISENVIESKAETKHIRFYFDGDGAQLTFQAWSCKTIQETYKNEEPLRCPLVGHLPSPKAIKERWKQQNAIMRDVVSMKVTIAKLQELQKAENTQYGGAAILEKVFQLKKDNLRNNSSGIKDTVNATRYLVTNQFLSTLQRSPNSLITYFVRLVENPMKPQVCKDFTTLEQGEKRIAGSILKHISNIAESEEAFFVKETLASFSSLVFRKLNDTVNIRLENSHSISMNAFITCKVITRVKESKTLDLQSIEPLLNSFIATEQIQHMMWKILRRSGVYQSFRGLVHDLLDSRNGSMRKQKLLLSRVPKPIQIVESLLYVLHAEIEDFRLNPGKQNAIPMSFAYVCQCLFHSGSEFLYERFVYNYLFSTSLSCRSSRASKGLDRENDFSHSTGAGFIAILISDLQAIYHQENNSESRIFLELMLSIAESVSNAAVLFEELGTEIEQHLDDVDEVTSTSLKQGGKPSITRVQRVFRKHSKGIKRARRIFAEISTPLLFPLLLKNGTATIQRDSSTIVLSDLDVRRLVTGMQRLTITEVRNYNDDNQAVKEGNTSTRAPWVNVDGSQNTNIKFHRDYIDSAVIDALDSLLLRKFIHWPPLIRGSLGSLLPLRWSFGSNLEVSERDQNLVQIWSVVVSKMQEAYNLLHAREQCLVSAPLPNSVEIVTPRKNELFFYGGGSGASGIVKDGYRASLSEKLRRIENQIALLNSECDLIFRDNENIWSEIVAIEESAERKIQEVSLLRSRCKSQVQCEMKCLGKIITSAQLKEMEHKTKVGTHLKVGTLAKTPAIKMVISTFHENTESGAQRWKEQDNTQFAISMSSKDEVHLHRKKLMSTKSFGLSSPLQPPIVTITRTSTISKKDASRQTLSTTTRKGTKARLRVRAKEAEQKSIRRMRQAVDVISKDKSKTKDSIFHEHEKHIRTTNNTSAFRISPKYSRTIEQHARGLHVVSRRRKGPKLAFGRRVKDTKLGLQRRPQTAKKKQNKTPYTMTKSRKIPSSQSEHTHFQHIRERIQQRSFPFMDEEVKQQEREGTERIAMEEKYTSTQSENMEPVIVEDTAGFEEALEMNASVDESLASFVDASTFQDENEKGGDGERECVDDGQPEKIVEFTKDQVPQFHVEMDEKVGMKENRTEKSFEEEATSNIRERRRPTLFQRARRLFSSPQQRPTRMFSKSIGSV
eukprot:g3827.t1